ncbi:hypothetical protein GPECTOR_45g157 [Gonium pectorale]|uniref:UGGT thioredoxin-like domain-containing protein n=1 Tax=Gonium pectorale TaxID=33097 RepID=A0A150G8W7_GONPE|nr:hypothetical protein GPECTOR_45g157 [Gonium pectorale]|eukprot:KXZ46287.1 hypothetical protein GPECTOR_45g157 [Gonium pectorale]
MRQYLAEEDPSLVWPFLDRLSDLSSVAAGEQAGDEECWRSITAAATQLVTPGVGKLLPLVLASRQYAAKLQMVRQLAEQLHREDMDQGACCFVSVDGRVAATPLLLMDLLAEKPAAGAGEELFSFDHVYRGAGSSSTSKKKKKAVHTAILYGSPGLPCFAPFHRLLRADAKKLVYAFRPLLLSQCEPYSGCARTGAGGTLLLPGWGVEAALKNTEYSAVDDKEAARQRELAAQKAAAAGDSGDGDDPAALFGSGEAAVVKGFRLDVLAGRRPDLRQELLTFRDQLAAGDDEEGADIKTRQTD